MNLDFRGKKPELPTVRRDLELSSGSPHKRQKRRPTERRPDRASTQTKLKELGQRIFVLLRKAHMVTFSSNSDLHRCTLSIYSESSPRRAKKLFA
jgi:hypothetical protein